MTFHHSIIRTALGRRLALGAVLLLLVGFSGLHITRAVRIHAVVPAPPEVGAKPAAFHRRHEADRAKAQSWISPTEGLIRLGELYHANGFSQAALQCWLAMRKLEPANARWTCYLADLYRQIGDDESAADMIELTAQLDPEHEPAWLKAGEQQLKLGHLDAAENSYHRRLELTPADPYARFGLARVQHQRQEDQTALKTLRLLVTDHPDFSPAQNLLAVILRQAGETAEARVHQLQASQASRFTEAIDPWVRQLREHCYDARKLIVWGAMEEQARRTDQAVTLYRRAMAFAPEDYQAYQLLGHLHLQAHQIDEAIEVLSQGVSRVGASESMWADLCEAHLTRNDSTRALDVASRALSRLPESGILHNVKGRALAQATRYEEAIASFEQALTLSPHLADPAFNMALAHLRQGQPDLAHVALERSLQRRPGYAEALVLLAGMDIESGRLNTAYPKLDRVYSDYPDMENLRLTFSQWYLQAMLAAAQAGQPDQAIELGETGVQRLPEASQLHGFLGLVYSQQERYQEAVRALETARSLNPADLRIVASLVQVYAGLGQAEDARHALILARDAAREIGDTNSANQFEAMLRTVPSP